MSKFKVENNKRVFDTGATKNISKGKGRYDLIPCEALEALAKRFEFGVEQGHEENGYRKGIPDNVLFDSAMRHLNQARAGYEDEDHLAAVMWNVSVLIFNREQRPKSTIEVNFGTHLDNLYKEKGDDENN